MDSKFVKNDSEPQAGLPEPLVPEMDGTENTVVGEKDYQLILEDLKRRGLTLRTDQNQPRVGEKPDWFDEELYKNAKKVYKRFLFACNFAHLSGLLLLVRIDSIHRTLDLTGGSATVSKCFERYYATLRHVKSWYEGDIFKSGSEAQRNLMIVRGMHNKTSAKFNQVDSTDCLEQKVSTLSTCPISGQVHISQYDMLITQFAFIGLIVTNPNDLGFKSGFSRKDLESILHFWRVIGYYLGIRDDMNLCSYSLEDIYGLCKAILDVEYKQSVEENTLETPPGLMSLNIVRSLKFLPSLTFYGISRYLYELLGVKTDDIEYKKNWRTMMNYKLTKFSLTSDFSSTRPMRALGNGMVRLNVYGVGKVKRIYKQYLDSKYNEEEESHTRTAI